MLTEDILARSLDLNLNTGRKRGSCNIHPLPATIPDPRGEDAAAAKGAGQVSRGDADRIEGADDDIPLG